MLLRVRGEILSTVQLPQPGRQKRRPKVGLQWSACHLLRFRRRDTVGHQWAGQHRTDIGTCLQCQAIPESISNETSTGTGLLFKKMYLDLTRLSSSHVLPCWPNALHGAIFARSKKILPMLFYAFTRATHWIPCWTAIGVLIPRHELQCLNSSIHSHITVTKSWSPESSLYRLCLSRIPTLEPNSCVNQCESCILNSNKV